MILWAVLAVVLVVFDQVSKFLVVKNIGFGDSINVIPKLFDFTYVKNTGAAFSVLSEHTWLLSIISVVFCIGIAVWFFMKKPESKLLKLATTFVFAGALGNAIDRVFLGYVVDFIETVFMDFPVFNVADILVCVGAGLFLVYELFFDTDIKKEKKNG